MLKLINQERLERKLRRIPDKVAKRVKADLILAGREINVMQRALAPREDDVLIGTIKTEPMRDPYIGALVKAGGPNTTVEVREGSSTSYDYAMAQEYGTQKMSANPFFWPAIRAKAKQTKREMRKAIRMGIREGSQG